MEGCRNRGSGSSTLIVPRWPGVDFDHTLYIDADACPVKDEAVRAAEGHGLVRRSRPGVGKGASKRGLLAHAAYGPR